jgi:hypothetical protein
MAKNDEEPAFDSARAERLIGKTVLIGLTRIDKVGDVTKQSQLYGHITAFDETIATVRLDDGEDFTLPPDLEAFEQAPPGEYRLRSTGQVVVDPDLLSTWTIRAPSDGEEGDEGEP